MGNRPASLFFTRFLPKAFSVQTKKPCFPLSPWAMEVTKHNFDAVFPRVSSAIADADFVAIDGEFTGLQADNQSARYCKKGHTCS